MKNRDLFYGIMTKNNLLMTIIKDTKYFKK